MPRYIDADKIVYWIRHVSKDGLETDVRKVAFLDEIKRMPTADVVEVKHGKWVGKPLAGYCTVMCSVCGSVFLVNSGRWKYCPNCGAKMDKE